MIFHIILVIKITTTMTIIISSFHVLFHIDNHLSSFRLIIYSYHIHTIEWSKSASDFKVIICCYHILFKEWSKFNWTNFKAFLKNILFFLVIILSSLWCIGSSSMSYPYKACYAIILWDLNPIHYDQGASILKLMFYPLDTIEFESICWHPLNESNVTVTQIKKIS